MAATGLGIGLTAAATTAAAQELEQVWETEALLRVPESVAWDPARHVLYVSNIAGDFQTKDGVGFVSVLTPEGEIRDLEWVDGLNAPKGLAVSGDRLYVADMDELVEIDIPHAKIVARHRPEGAQFLNGIDVAPDGSVYVTDSFAARIYRLRHGEVETWFADPALGGINGIIAEAGRLVSGSFQSGGVWEIDLGTKAVHPLAEGLGAFDGIVSDGEGGYFLSDWAGRVFASDLSGPEAAPETLLDTREASKSAADIEYVPSLELLLVPTFGANRVTAYRLKD